jgi:methylenetetrahydrofolate reductase (NADPH)
MGFQDALLEKKEFVITCELVPGRGFRGVANENVLKFADQAKGASFLHGLTLTDNAGGNPALCADVLGPEIQSMGIDAIVHFSCKDFNRNSFESHAFALKRAGITNLLVVTGDYPVSGFLGTPKPVFDIDSVMALHFLREMNAGLEITSGKKQVKLDPTDFFAGAAVSPFKPTEGSAVMQYMKMEKKIRAGARFLVTQLGYDARKYYELLAYVRRCLGLDIPVLGSVYLLSSGAARYMNSGQVPGAYVTDGLLSIVREEAKADDRGKGARLERAARQIAVLKGLGYSGAHIEGLNLKFPDVSHAVERAFEIGENWRDYVEEFRHSPDEAFFFFQGGSETAPLLDAEPVDPIPSRRRRRRVYSPIFWIMVLVHKLFFVEGTLGYRLMRGLSRFAEKHRFWYHLESALEGAAKRALFDCRRCDDCALFELYYLCPESRCPKGQRIGPCGGSRNNGRCEVFEESWCIWELIYRRAARKKEVEKLSFIIPPRNWELYETSSWVNYFLKKDHSGSRVTLPGRYFPFR